MQLAFEDRGEGSAVVFLHGITVSKRTWNPIVSRMEHDHRCISVDLPGHGESPDGPYGAVEMAAAVHNIVEELGLAPVLLVGHSLGGMTATIYAAVHGALGVVNIDQPLHLGSVVEMMGSDLTRFRDERFDEAFAEFANQLRIDLIPEPRRTELLAEVKPRRDVVVALWADLLDGNADAMQPLLDGALAAITCPYLAIYGSEPSAPSRAAVGLIPHSALEVWDGLGHLLHLVDPDRFVRRLNTFESSIAHNH